MRLDFPADETKAVVAPLLERVGGELAALLVQAAAQLAADRAKSYMDKAAVAEHFGVAVSTIEGWMLPRDHASKLGLGMPYFKFRGAVRFRRDRVDVWALNHEENTPPVLALERAA
jgi:hypothetical protein